MIVSGDEIRRALSLARQLGADAVPAQAEPTPAPHTDSPPDPVPYEAAEDRDRADRICELRESMASGEYEVEPLEVAEKMIGRAICDQVARHMDR